jgi:hypothetical protein
MSLTPHYATVALNAKVDALAALLDGGTLQLYTRPQPASADVAVTTQIRLATLPLQGVAFTPAKQGKASVSATLTASAEAEGTVTWFRAMTKTGTPVLDGSVGTEEANLIVSSAKIARGIVIEIREFMLQELAGT